HELYFRGYLEVPRCSTDGSDPFWQENGPPGEGQIEDHGQGIEQVPAGVGIPSADQGARSDSWGRNSIPQFSGQGLRQPDTGRRASRQNRPVPPRPDRVSARNGASGAGDLVGPIGYDVD
ncbi:MAG: hypothetical protein ACC645_19840, partial [Pirellulales bacterium]